jgi:hypothetical protein
MQAKFPVKEKNIGMPANNEVLYQKNFKKNGKNVS